MTFREELNAFLKLLDEFDDNSPLVNYTHRILCETYKNEFIKLNQPAAIRNEDGTETGPCGNECFIENKVWKARYYLNLPVKTIKYVLNTDLDWLYNNGFT